MVLIINLLKNFLLLKGYVATPKKDNKDWKALQSNAAQKYQTLESSPLAGQKTELLKVK